jgi:ferredoxin
MSYRADPDFLQKLKKYGPVNIESCFNCGNCTAICPLSTDTDNFPRRVIRLAQLGLEDRLLESKELWSCYYCGECSQTCPREADPGEFMATARRYAIARYDRFGLARLLYTSPVFNIIFLVVLAVFFGWFLYSQSDSMPSGELDLFAFIPSELIHNLGLIAGGIIAVTALTGMVTMAINVSKAANFPKGTRLNWWGALWDTLVKEVLGQNRYRQDCERYGSDDPWYLRKWYLHATVLWGFIGLFVATALNYLLELIGVKPTGTWMPLWNPIRLLGTIAGLSLVYGATMLIVNRLKKKDESYQHSMPSDWSFLLLMWLAGVTGFVLEIAIYLPQPHAWSYWGLLVHLVVVGELLLLAPFTKFAHAVYRSIGLYIAALKPLPEREKASAAAD